ncbi:antibiotic biosynthesis monooxygenase family protein [Rhodococcus opacus]|uniref:hypothetical protein n=1 Tax=Rhodococcus opacus TaxID=37919 RepID=UPI002949CB3C|nr:hypothetical protein [Rhodococcus opacus]MDV6240320.1 hypothetical protein [Rhodococcus opacus]
MFKVTKLVHLVADTDASTGAVLAGRLREAAAPRARRVLVTPALPGGINGGDVIAHLHVRTIGTSQLSRVHESAGSARWTHVWEQEYANLDGLLGPYMTHPYHWAHIDRWFGPERGPRIVTRLCQGFCVIDGPTITVAAPATPR